jgi:hypothetical protein
VIRSDLALMFASLLHAIDRARRVGDTVRVRDLRWHLAALWAHVGKHGRGQCAIVINGGGLIQYRGNAPMECGKVRPVRRGVGEWPLPLG